MTGATNTPPPVPEGVERMDKKAHAVIDKWARAGEKGLAPDHDDTALLLANAYLRMRGEVERLKAIVREVWRLELIIESAVRNLDPRNRPAVVAMLASVRAALAEQDHGKGKIDE